MDRAVQHRVIEIWHLAQLGERSTAKHRIIHLLREQPELVPAWLLMAELLETNDEKVQCYQRVLQIDANNKVALQFFKFLDTGIENTDDEASNIPDLFEDEYLSANRSRTLIQPTEEEMVSEDAFEDDVDQVVADQDDGGIDDTLAVYVIKELGDHVDADYIIREVSLRSQMDWYEAEKYVNEIKERHALAIAKRRSPLLLFIAIPTLTAGIVWFLFTVVFIMTNSDNSINLVATLVQSIRHFIGSLAMMLGGSVGIYRVLKSLGKIN